MATRTEYFNGVTAGATPAGGNTITAGDTSAPATVTPGTGTATVVGTTTTGEVIEGAASVKGSYTGNGSGFTSMARPASATVGAIGYYLHLPVATPTAAVTTSAIRNTGGKSASTALLTSGKFKWSTASADLYTCPSALAAGTYWVTQAVDTGTAANNDGRMAFAVYDSTGALAGGMVSGDIAARTGLAGVGAGAFLSADQVGGKIDASTTLTAAWVVEWDSIISTDTFALIPPPSSSVNVGPTATIMARPAPQAPGTVTVTGLVSDDSSVKTAVVTIVSGPNSPTVNNSTTNLNTSAAGVTGTFAGVAGRYVVRVSGTDNNDVAVASPPTQIIDVYALTDADVLPYAELSGTYTRYGTASTDLGAVTDTDVTTGLQSALSPAAEKERWQWCAFGPGDIKFKMVHDQTPTSPAISVQFTVYKEDGVTQVYQTTLAAPLTAGQEDVIAVDLAGLALVPNLADRRALITETSATQ